jgi:serine protease Do
VQRGEIGVRFQTVTPALASSLGLPRDWGVVVSDVLPNGAAAQSGIAIGDLVVSLDRKPMENARQLDVNLYRHPAGSTVQLELLRGTQRLMAAVKVEERPGDPARFAALVSPEQNLVPPLGILALDVDDQLKRMLFPLRKSEGVLVAASSGAASQGHEPILPGDVIYSLNGKAIASVAALREALGALDHDAEAVLQVQRGGELHFLVLELE